MEDKIVRLLLKILAMPIILVLTLIESIGHYIITFSSFIFFLFAGFCFIGSVGMIMTDGFNSLSISAFIFGLLVFLIPNIAEWIVEKVADINECIKDFVGM